ncbi:hypothetical protein GCM10017674_64980 [Streptomyces gardneri]|nr:hypothetical protein GCM10017674_64980 [Streptomyces gardneri]
MLLRQADQMISPTAAGISIPTKVTGASRVGASGGGTCRNRQMPRPALGRGASSHATTGEEPGAPVTPGARDGGGGTFGGGGALGGAGTLPGAAGRTS